MGDAEQEEVAMEEGVAALPRAILDTADCFARSTVLGGDAQTRGTAAYPKVSRRPIGAETGRQVENSPES